MADALFTRRFLGLWLFAFVTFFAAFQLLPAVPFRILQLGGSKAMAGWFLSVYTFASAASAPLMGNVADHVGRKRLLMTASFLFIGFSILYGVVTHIGILLLIALIHGSLWSGLMASASAIMSEFIPESRRTEGLAYWGLASTAAIGIAPAVGLIVFQSSGWMVLCSELAVLSLVMLIWSWRLPVIAEAPPTRPSSLAESWDWRALRAALSLAVVCFGYGGVTSYVAILSRERGLHPESLYFTVFAGSIVVVRVFTSRLGDILGPKAILYPSYAAMPISFALLAVAYSRWQLVASAILFGIGLGGAYPALANFLLSNSDPKRRARTFGSIIWAFDTGIASGSLLIGEIGQRWSLGTSFAVAAVISCLAIPIFVAASRAIAIRDEGVGAGAL